MTDTANQSGLFVMKMIDLVTYVVYYYLYERFNHITCLNLFFVLVLY